MSITSLAGYDPYANEQYDVQHSKFRAQWYAAYREKDAKKRRELKDECFKTLRNMRRSRILSYEKPSDYAPLLLNKVRERAARQGFRDVLLPEAQSFKTLKDLLNFAARSQDYIDAHIRRHEVISQLKYDLGVDPTYRRGCQQIMTINPSALGDGSKSLRP